MKYRKLLKEMKTEKGHEGNYTIYFIENVSLSEIAKQLADKNLPWEDDSFMCGYENKHGAGFEVQSGYPEDAIFLSKLFPDKLVIAEGCWNLDYWKYYLSGRKATGYHVAKTQESRADYDPSDPELFDVTIDFYDRNNIKIYSAFFGAVDKETAENL